MMFLTPHIIDDEEDIVEVMRIKEAQRQEFIRRFYGRSQDQQTAEMQKLLQYSMNVVDQPSLFRGPTSVPKVVTLGSEPMMDSTRDAIQDALDDMDLDELGDGAGELPSSGGQIIIEGEDEVLDFEETAAPVEEVEPSAPAEESPQAPTEALPEAPAEEASSEEEEE
jgi:hypothetical protein